MTTDGLLNIAALTAGIIMVLILLVMDFRSAWISVLVSVFVSVPLYLISRSFVPFLVLFLSVSSVKLLYSRLFFLVAPWLLAISIQMYLVQVPQLIWQTFDIATGFGTAIGIFTDMKKFSIVRKNEASRGTDRQIEMKRDVVQIGSGIILVALDMAFGQGHIRIAVSIVAFLLYMAGNYFSLFPENGLARLTHSLERPSTPLGVGAIWFAAGTLIALGLVHSTDVLAVILFAVTIGDPTATMIGSRLGSHKLPFNHKKSLAGFLGILSFSSAFGYLLLGIDGIVLGVVSALVESLSYYPLDDNFMIPVVMGIVAFLF